MWWKSGQRCRKNWYRWFRKVSGRRRRQKPPGWPIPPIGLPQPSVARKHYRHRGLCWHYQHDLYRELRRRPLHYFSLGCCVRDRGRGGEHHVVYIKAKNGQWPAIIMLDAWWYAGRLKVEDESDAEDWVDDPKSTEILNTIYPAGHQRPMEHWSMVRKGTRYADYVYSDLPAARDSAQWKHMQEQMKEGLKRRGGKPFEY